jgi:hypothetical protein
MLDFHARITYLLALLVDPHSHLCDISRLLLLVISNHWFSKISFFCVFSLVCFLHNFQFD